MFRWKDGRTYKGEWFEGKQHGIGYYKESVDVKERMGMWDHGKRERWISEDELLQE